MNAGVLATLASLLLAACAPPHVAAPYTDAEIDRALTPVRGLRARCYAPSRSAAQRARVVVDFTLAVEDDGAVRSRPKYASADDAELLECLRHGLDALRFPARGREWLRVHLELGPAVTPRSPASKT